MEKFLELMAEIMEVDVDTINQDSVFRESCDFDSMKGFAMICMIEDEYHKNVSVDTFLDCKTIADLYKAAGN